MPIVERSTQIIGLDLRKEIGKSMCLSLASCANATLQ